MLTLQPICSTSRTLSMRSGTGVRLPRVHASFPIATYKEPKEGRSRAGPTIFSSGFFLGSALYDHQCGFKAFNKQKILPVIPAIRSRHWFWDTELLVRGQRQGLSVREFPVRWRAGKGTTVKIRDVFEMGSSILRLWWQVHVSED